ncbi:MAG: hypothetical protein QXJ18_01945 [Desulfurococcaceae archaeon]
MKENKHVTLTILVLLLIVTFVTPIVTAQAPPYKVGDWFKYRAEIEVSILGERASCWAEFKLEILEVNTAESRVEARVSLLNFGGNEVCREAFSHFNPFYRETAIFSLTDHPSSGKVLINPEYTGTYDCSEGGIECTLKYRKGVLTDLRIRGSSLGAEIRVKISLVDSSVLEFSLWKILLIIGIIAIPIVIVVVLVIFLRRRTKALSQQLSPSTPPPTVSTGT